jgi:LacI family transcriptional regulator
VVPDITNPLFPHIIRGIEDALSVHDYVAIIVNTDSRLRREASVLEMLRNRGVEGMVVASAERQDEALEKMVEAGIPIVTVNRRVEDPTVASVISDETEGVRLALDHLVGLGHRRIAAIAGPQGLSTGRDRYEALMRLFAEGPEDLILSGVTFAEGFNEAEGERCMNELLATAPDFTAVIAANDRLAIGAISQIKAHKLRCPEDISITGYNDMALVDRLDPPLTTVRIQQYIAGARAAEMLIGFIENRGEGGVVRHVVLPVDLVVRGSTAPARARR